MNINYVKYPCYIVSLVLIMPLIFLITDACIFQKILNISLIGKWFIFWAIGVRLLTAGISQIFYPKFTIRSILKIDKISNSTAVIELGLANLSMGLTGILSLFIPSWRTAVALSGGLFMGLCGILHITKKTRTLNTNVAMLSDIIIACIMLLYLLL